MNLSAVPRAEHAQAAESGQRCRCARCFHARIEANRAHRDECRGCARCAEQDAATLALFRSCLPEGRPSDCSPRSADVFRHGAA